VTPWWAILVAVHWHGTRL